MVLRVSKIFSVIRVVFILLLLVISPPLPQNDSTTAGPISLHGGQSQHREVPGWRSDAGGDDSASASGQETSVRESSSTDGDLLSQAECEVSLVCVVKKFL